MGRRGRIQKRRGRMSQKGKRVADFLEAATFELSNACNHTSPRIGGEFFEAKIPIEAAHVLIERVRQNTKATDFLRKPHGGPDGEHQQRPCHVLPLISMVDSQLPQQEDDIRSVTLGGFWQVSALDLSCAERHITRNQSLRLVAYDRDARNTGFMIVPSMAAEPIVERLAATVKSPSVVIRRERTWRRQSSHTGRYEASLRNAGTSLAGLAAHLSNSSHFSAGIVTTRRSMISISAASTALRRMKSLRLVRDCSAACSKRSRSSRVTRTLTGESFDTLAFLNSIHV